jgi:hypothetical protein
MPIPVALPGLVGAGPGIPGTSLQPRLATLGELTFGVADQYGTLVYLNRVDGWSGATGTTNQVDQRASDSGGWLDPAYMPPRAISLSLTLVGGSHRLTEQSVDAITAGIPLDTLETLTVYSTDGSALQADVRQGGDVLASQTAATAQVSVALIAPDPRRYSTTSTQVSTGLPVTSGGRTIVDAYVVNDALVLADTATAGVLAVTNDGNMATRPTLTVMGPSPAFWLTHIETGKTLRFADPIAAGRSLVIDTDRRRAILDGTAARTVTGTWFEYAPGANTVAFGAATYDPGALLISVHRSAWK